MTEERVIPTLDLEFTNHINLRKRDSSIVYMHASCSTNSVLYEVTELFEISFALVYVLVLRKTMDVSFSLSNASNEVAFLLFLTAIILFLRDQAFH